MTGVTIYMEGGGDYQDGKAQLRQGMDAFLIDLKSKVREKRWKWKMTPCGGRQNAHDAFQNARNYPRDGEIIILLVDAEAPVTAATRAEHLRMRKGDGWDLTGVHEETIHLMVQTMETWIVADPTALRDYYGQHFKGNFLPKAIDLETVANITVANALDKATRQAMPKGVYHKIRHASDLLKKIDPSIVQRRCPSCARLFNVLGNTINRI